MTIKEYLQLIGAIEGELIFLGGSKNYEIRKKK